MSNNYFSHDFFARNDPKLLEVQMEMGGQGLAIWWCIVEMLWEQDGFVQRNYKSLSFSLRWATAEEVRKVVEDFGLFNFDDERIWNESALARKEMRDAIVEKKREGGRRGGKKRAENEDEMKDTSSIPQAYLEHTSSIPQAIKLNKTKLNKIKDSFSSSCAHTREEGEEQEQKEEIFLIFFFERNFTDPVYEVNRFFNYYDARGWKWGDTAIESKTAVALQWTPEKKDLRFNPAFLEWVKKIYDTAITQKLTWNPLAMLKSISKGEVNTGGFDIRIQMTTKWGAETVAKFVQENALDTNLKIDYRFKK